MRAKPDWLKEVFPWQQKSVVVNGQNMAYVDEGSPDARPVLLLHGNPTWAFLYRFFIPPLLEAGYRVIAPDGIGSGYSDHPRIDARLTLAHHIADLVALMDHLKLRGFAIVGQDWGGPQGVGAALQRVERLDAMVLMNTWLFVGWVGPFHASPVPWTTLHAPIIGQWMLKRRKVLSHGGPTGPGQSRRGLSAIEVQAYRHIYDEPDSEHVTLTWPRTIPLNPGDRGYADMEHIHRRLPELANVPTLLAWAPEDRVFPIEYAHRLKELLPHAEGPVTYDRALHFLQEDRGADIARDVVAFLNRTVGNKI